MQVKRCRADDAVQATRRCHTDYLREDYSVLRDGNQKAEYVERSVFLIEFDYVRL